MQSLWNWVKKKQSHEESHFEKCKARGVELRRTNHMKNHIKSRHRAYLRLSGGYWVNTDSDTKMHRYSQSLNFWWIVVKMSFRIKNSFNCGFVNLCAIAISSYLSKSHNCWDQLNFLILPLIDMQVLRHEMFFPRLIRVSVFLLCHIPSYFVQCCLQYLVKSARGRLKMKIISKK